MSGQEYEPEKDRIQRLHDKPLTATKFDVTWLAMQVLVQRDAISVLKQKDGRFFGLREAAELIEAAQAKELRVRFIAGKREREVRAVNVKLLSNTAKLIRRYADDAQNQTGPFAPKPAAPAPEKP